MNNMYAVVLVLVVITSTSSTLCFASNNAGDQEIFMVVDDETTFYDAAMGMSKANPVQIGKFLLEDGKQLTLSRKSSPGKNCISQDQPCGALDWCCDWLTCDGFFNGRCHPDMGCRASGTFCTQGSQCCSNICIGVGGFFGGVCAKL